MNDNLPEINFKEKKEKKGGALGWLRSRLGWGSRGAMGEAGINPAAMNVGRALGTGTFGTSSSGGLAALLAGKMGMIATVAMVAVASGVYLANNAPAPSTSTAAFSSNKSADNYVPAILRSQAANQGSSLDMFKETNKGAVAMESEAKPAKAADAKPVDASADAQAQDPNAPAPGGDQANMGQEMMGKLQGGSMGSLTSQLGGGSSKFSGMGGFGNKFGSGAMGAKTGFSSGIGSGFSAMPKFDSRKGKMLAMKGAARPVFSGAKAGGKKGAIGAGAFGQAKGMRAIQKSFSGSSIDGARSTQDKAWEGTTGEGAAAAGGAGISDGGAGIMTSPSLDNGAGSTGGGNADEPVVPDASDHSDASPWASLPSQILMLITASILLSAIASYLVSIGNTPYTFPLKVLGWALAAVAMGLALYACYLGYTLMSQYGQSALGLLYIAGGGCAAVAAGLAFAGSAANNSMQLAFSAMAGVAVLIGSMLGGK